MTRAKDSLADWLLGGAGKRSLLRTLASAKKADRFTQRDLAHAAGLHEKGSVVRHLAVLEQAGLLKRDAGGRYCVESASALLPPLRRWLRTVDAIEAKSSAWQAPLPPSRGK